MKRINEYIFESQEIVTTSNRQRKRELEKWLKHKKYDDYVATLNKMLEDPKSKSLLEDGFGGALGDTRLNFSYQELEVGSLIPTQSNIDMSKSMKHPLKDIKSLVKTFSKPITLNKPLITYNKKYIIDGHHTWLQGAVLNPKGRIECFNYDGNISPIQMLKVVQGTIAAVKANDNNNNGQLPSCSADGPNLFKCSEHEIRNYVKENLDKNLIWEYSKYISECTDFNSTVEWLTKRLCFVQKNNAPIDAAPTRKNMPQLYKAGTDENNNDTALPDSDGSAMNKLKKDKYAKSVVK